MNYEVPTSHPRYHSLMARERIVAGVERGITSMHGLIAQGRGEAFDYLIGEQSQPFALDAIDAAVCALIDARAPVFSINGNVAALVAAEMVALAQLFTAKLEVNIFHASKEREKAIQDTLLSAGAQEVLLPQEECTLAGMDHNRRFVHPDGIHSADVVFVPLEDGDRCQALVQAGKTVIIVDLNPKSRTAQTAHVAIIDNILRVTQHMQERHSYLSEVPAEKRQEILSGYDNGKQLVRASQCISDNFGQG